MSQNKTPAYGGQAVIEGVMFAGKHTSVTAIRRKDHSIEFFEVKKKPHPLLTKLRKIPFLRGFVAIIEASANGTKHLTFSSDRYDLDPEDDEKNLQEREKESSKLALILGVATIGVLSFLFGKFIFTIIPAVLASFTLPIFPGRIEQNIIEGLIKLLFLLTYIYFISMTPIIKRVFQYHGAEHKVINAYENGLPLTIQNVQNQSRLHYRCGSSFILFTVVIGVFVYMFVPYDPLWQRIVYRLLLIPIVLGISFEVLQFTNKIRHIPLLKFLGYPGLWLQLLTTKEPTNQQVEVSILSFQEMLKRDKAYELADQQAK